MVRFHNEPRKAGEPSKLPSYGVRDLRPDGTVAMDAWSDYLRCRFAQRETLYGTFKPSEQDSVRKEIRRIRYFRGHFGDYKVSSSDDFPLVTLLEDSRARWRTAALKRSSAELARCQKEIEKHGETPQRARDQTILRFVQMWDREDYEALRASASPDRYMDDLDSDRSDHGDDDPRQPNYGYNGWVIAWEEARGGVNLRHPLVQGNFPHQKIAIQQLLYNKTETPLRREAGSQQLRYFHLPANNMQWVEDAMSRYYSENNVEFDGKRVPSGKSNAQRLLRNELWRGHQRGGTNLPAHSRQMGSRCSIISSAPLDGSKGKDSVKGSRKDVALFMPFLHWEVEKRLNRMTQFVQGAKARQEHQERLRRASTTRYNRRNVDLSQMRAQAAALKPSRPLTGFEAESHRRALLAWRPQKPLAKYLWHAAKLFQIIDEAADGRLIDDHLYASPPLHMRRTLEQFYYWTAHDTATRDRDQVVCKATRAHSGDPEDTGRMVMVDQLWLWILDENTIISSFPRRWGRNKPDPSAVHRGIRDRLGALDPDEIQSVYDLAFVIIDECSRVFFDRTKPVDQRPDVVDILGSSISTIGDKKTVAYQDFGDAVSQISINNIETVEKIIRRSLNIGFEWSILVEAQQVIDELQIMQEIFKQQSAVMKDFEKALKSMFRGPMFGSDKQTLVHQRAREGLDALIGEMEQRREELASMERLQTKTRAQLRELLDMKQQQANIAEARSAIQRADESVLQGRSIVVFTVVTIFFLPLSFFATFFGMNAPELNEGGVVPLRQQLTYMFAISSVVIVVSLAVAFSTWTRTALAVAFNIVYATVEHRMGWRNKKSNYNSTALKNKQRAMFKRMDSQAIARKVTEIIQRTESGRPEQGAPFELQSGPDWSGGNKGRFRSRQIPSGAEAV